MCLLPAIRVLLRLVIRTWMLEAILTGGSMVNESA